MFGRTEHRQCGGDEEPDFGPGRSCRRPSAAIPARAEAEQRCAAARTLARQSATVGRGPRRDRQRVPVRRFRTRSRTSAAATPASGLGSVFRRRVQVRLLRSGQVPDEGDSKLRRPGKVPRRCAIKPDFLFAISVEGVVTTD